MNNQRPDTHQKAIELNLDQSRYGTIAEIGAGQEVARWFFRVGGAAGTVAKTMSAYDMTFSDAIYGESEQYVSRQRLRVMLKHEYGLLEERLGEIRGKESRFFSYAATVATRSYSRRSDGHGWLGVRFQLKPQTPASDILVHARVFDEENYEQQETLGILGINLIWAASKYGVDADRIVDALMDGLSRRRVEIDVVLFDGPDYKHVDNQLITVSLVEKNLTHVVFFSPEGGIKHGTELLYKRPVVIERGRFAPVTEINLKMMESGRNAFQKHLGADDSAVLEIMEISLNNLLGTKGIDHDDFLARLDILTRLGKTVMVSNYGEFYKLAAHINRYTREPIGFVLSVILLRELFDSKYYTDLPGGILESFSKIFESNVRLLAFPAKEETSEEVLTVESLKVAAKLQDLYAYLLSNEILLPLDSKDPQPVALNPEDLRETIRRGDASWKTKVTPFVAQMIEGKGYWGSKKPVT